MIRLVTQFDDLDASPGTATPSGACCSSSSCCCCVATAIAVSGYTAMTLGVEYDRPARGGRAVDVAARALVVLAGLLALPLAFGAGYLALAATESLDLTLLAFVVAWPALLWAAHAAARTRSPGGRALAITFVAVAVAFLEALLGMFVVTEGSGAAYLVLAALVGLAVVVFEAATILPRRRRSR